MGLKVFELKMELLIFPANYYDDDDDDDMKKQMKRTYFVNENVSWGFAPVFDPLKLIICMSK